MWIPKDLHSHSHSQRQAPLGPDLTPSLPPQLPWPPSSAPRQHRYRYGSPSSLFLSPNQSYRLCEICINHAVLHCIRTLIYQNSIWMLSSSFTSLMRPSVRSFPPASSLRRPQPPPSSLLIFRSLHPSPCSFPQKLISWSPRSSPFPGVETHYHVSVGKTLSMRGLTLSRTEPEKAFPCELLLHTPYTPAWFSLQMGGWIIGTDFLSDTNNATHKRPEKICYFTQNISIIQNSEILPKPLGNHSKNTKNEKGNPLPRQNIRYIWIGVQRFFRNIREQVYDKNVEEDRSH